MSTTAQATGGASALFVALVLVRFQSLMATIGKARDKIDKLFYQLNKDQEYQNKTSEILASDNWEEYFKKVLELELECSFSESEFELSKSYLGNLVKEGRRTLKIAKRLNAALSIIFTATAFLITASLLAIPASIFISIETIKIAWMTVAIFTIGIYFYACRTLYQTLRLK